MTPGAEAAGATGAAPAGDAARIALVAVLLLEALLVVSPLLAVSSWWIGAQLLGKWAGQVRSPDVLLVGVSQLAGPLVVLLLLVAAVRVSGRQAGRPQWLALALQPAVAAFALVPLLRPMGTLGRVPVLALLPAALAVAGIVLVVVSWRQPGRGAPSRRSLALPLAAAAAAALSLLAGAGIGASSTRLPADPLLFLAPAPPTAPAGSAVPLPGRDAAPPQNPGLAADPYNSIHNDSWATDAYAIPGPREPLSAPTDSLFTGGDCATMTFDRQGRLLTLCSSLTTVTAWAVDPATMRPLARREVSSRPPSFTDFSGGGYFVLDADDRMVTPTRGGVVRALALRESGGALEFAEDASWDVSTALQEGEGVTSVVPDWQRRLWFVGARGTVGVIDPGNGSVRATNLGGESIENSFAVADGAVYVATGAAVYRLWLDASGAPQVVWREPYDTGTRQKPGQTSRATGTTPTVLDGGDLVAITDNADPRMSVVVMRTAASVNGPRVLCAVPVFAEGASATENSLVAVGRSLFVENNYGYQPAFTSVSAGGSVQPGLARVDVDPDAGGCRVAWANDSLSIPSLVSKASTADGTFYTYAKPSSPLGPDGWFATAVSLADGSVRWSRPLGGGLPFNNHYASVVVGPDGSLYVGTVLGIAVLRSVP